MSEANKKNSTVSASDICDFRELAMIDPFTSFRDVFSNLRQ